MAYGTSTTISYLGTMAVGAMEQDTGFAPATNGIAPKLRGAGNNNNAKVAEAREITPDTAQIDALCNRDISGSGAFTGVVPEIYTSTVGAGIGADRLKAHGTLVFGATPKQMAQSFFTSQGLTSTSKQLAPTLSKLRDGVFFDKMPGLDSFVYPADGVFPNYLGSGYPDYQSVVTNGISTLVKTATVENFQLLASDIINLGSAFDLSDIANFGNPGQVIGTINTANGLGITGLNVVLAHVGINPDAIYNLGLDIYNEVMQVVLNSVTTPELINNAQTLLGTSINNMESIGSYTDFDKIFINSKDIVTFSTMAEFREALQAVELGRIETLAQLGSYINSVEPATLPTIGNASVFTNADYINTMIAKFLGGTGPYDSILLSDMIGSLGGVGISTPADEYIAAMNKLYSAGSLTSIQTHLTQLVAGLGGAYTTGPVGPDNTYTINDPELDPISGDEAPPYASYQNAKIGQIEADCSALMSQRNVNSDIQSAIDAWDTVFKKVFDEKEFQSRVDMGFDIRTSYSDNSYGFIIGLRGTMDQYNKAPIINGMVNQAIDQGDIGGEYMRAYIKELENKLSADAFDIRWRAEFDE